MSYMDNHSQAIQQVSFMDMSDEYRLVSDRDIEMQALHLGFDLGTYHQHDNYAVMPPNQVVTCVVSELSTTIAAMEDENRVTNRYVDAFMISLYAIKNVGLMLISNSETTNVEYQDYLSKLSLVLAELDLVVKDAYFRHHPVSNNLPTINTYSVSNYAMYLPF